MNRHDEVTKLQEHMARLMEDFPPSEVASMAGEAFSNAYLNAKKAGKDIGEIAEYPKELEQRLLAKALSKEAAHTRAFVGATG